MDEVKKCSECGSGNMVVRSGKHGEFLACDRYPECKHTEQISKDKKPMVKPSSVNGHKAMYVSYVKDLVVAGKSVEEAIKLIKQAYDAF